MTRPWPSRALLAAGTVLLLTACAPASTDSSSPAPSTPASIASPAPTPSAEPTVASASMPGACGELISVDEIGDIIGMPVRAVEWSDITLPPDSSPADELPGEMAREAARTANERLDCMWWPTESGGWRLPVHVLRLDSATETALFDALADSTEYSRADIGGYPVFERSYENEVGGLSLSYAFVDGLWIATTTPTLPQPLAEIMTIIIGRVTAA